MRHISSTTQHYAHSVYPTQQLQQQHSQHHQYHHQVGNQNMFVTPVNRTQGMCDENDMWYSDNNVGGGGDTQQDTQFFPQYTPVTQGTSQVQQPEQIQV